jgi:hypothetical protein
VQFEQPLDVVRGVAVDDHVEVVLRIVHSERQGVLAARRLERAEVGELVAVDVAGLPALADRHLLAVPGRRLYPQVPQALDGFGRRSPPTGGVGELGHGCEHGGREAVGLAQVVLDEDHLELGQGDALDLGDAGAGPHVPEEPRAGGLDRQAVLGIRLLFVGIAVEDLEPLLAVLLYVGHCHRLISAGRTKVASIAARTASSQPPTE